MRAGRSVDFPISYLIIVYRLPSRRTEDYPDSQRHTIAIKSHLPENPTDTVYRIRFRSGHTFRPPCDGSLLFTHLATAWGPRIEEFTPGLSRTADFISTTIKSTSFALRLVRLARQRKVYQPISMEARSRPTHYRDRLFDSWRRGFGKALHVHVELVRSRNANERDRASFLESTSPHLFRHHV